jgi:hypothetical protein
MLWQSYRGDRIAIYTYNNRADSGYIDIDYIHYKYTRVVVRKRGKNEEFGY